MLVWAASGAINPVNKAPNATTQANNTKASGLVFIFSPIDKSSVILAHISRVIFNYYSVLISYFLLTLASHIYPLRTTDEQRMSQVLILGFY